MSDGEMPVGLNQLLRLVWLEETVALVRDENDRAAVERALDDRLASVLAVGSNTRRNSRAKTIIALLKIWRDGPEEAFAIRERGFDLLNGLPASSRIAVHWGMTLAVYPFWGGVASHVGRILRLQGSASAGQVQRRMRESHGDRRTVYVATQRTLRSFVDWGVLTDTGVRGVYAAGSPVEINASSLAAWLAEALLVGGKGATDAGHLLRDPSLFPFRIAPMTARDLVAQSPRLELVPHGFNEELVVLKNKRHTRS